MVCWDGQLANPGKPIVWSPSLQLKTPIVCTNVLFLCQLKIFGKFMCKCLRMLAVYIVTVVLAYITTFPSSETAYGGNYNLQYLFPQYRRYLHPDVSQYIPPPPVLQASEKIDVPKNALIPGRPISIFVPSAGLMNDRYSGFVETFNDNEEISEARDATLNHRVIFRDRINTVGKYHGTARLVSSFAVSTETPQSGLYSS